jgi:tetratricopeptide (TPR) repeat protein
MIAQSGCLRSSRGLASGKPPAGSIRGLAIARPQPPESWVASRCKRLSSALRPSRSLLIVLGAALFVLASRGTLCGGEGSADQRFLAGLRQRRLFELAESYCTGRLGDPQLEDPRRAELVIELSLTLADWAVHSAPDQRESLWGQALQVTEDFAQRHTASPQLLVVRLQGALGILARGELARQEAQLVARPERLLGEAQKSLSDAIRQFRALGEEVELELRERNLSARAAARVASPDRLTPRQLSSLRDNVHYQLARAYRNQAECYPDDSPDRRNALTLAVEMLDPLAKLDAEHPLAWKSRIDEILCHRLLADYPAAQRKIESLLAESPPAAVALRARAERLRLAVAIRRWDEATQILDAGRQIDGFTSGEMDFAFLETYLAGWRAASEAGRREEAATWQARANEMLRLIRSEDGPYWTRRAQMLLSGYVRLLSSGDLSMQIQAAENAYQSGQYDEALAAYDRAAQLARQQGDEDQAFESGFTAATIEHQRGRHEEAMVRYHQLAMLMPGQTRAPQAHLLAVYHAGQIAAKQGSGLDRYIALAEEHLATWPAAATADEARRRLGEAWEHRGQWQKAIEQYQAISPNDPRFAEVAEAVARSYETGLRECETAGEPAEPLASAAAAWFESLVIGPEGRWPEKWSPLHRRAAVLAARFRLNHTATDLARAEEILSAALEGSPDAPPEWQSTAKALLAFSLAAQGDRHEAAGVLEQISSGPPEQLLSIVEGLARIGVGAGPEVRAELAQLQLNAVDLLRTRRDALSTSDQRKLDRLEAQALAYAGRTDDAAEKYRLLCSAYPDDGEIQEGCARLLLARQDAASREAALAKWREVEGKSRPGTDRWFRAKFAVALLHYLSNNRQQAEKIVRLLGILHPEPRLRDRQVTARFLESLSPAMRAQFAELLKRAGQ